MSRDILPKSSAPPSTAGHLKRSQSPASLVLARQEDPALIVGLVLTCARQGRGGQEIPSLLLGRLHDMVRSGDPTCRLVLDFLNSKAREALREVSTYDLLAEIVSADPVTKEGW